MSLRDEPIRAVDLDAYAADVMRRPMTAPAGTWSVSLAISQQFLGGALSAIPGWTAAVVGAAYAPSCRVEISIALENDFRFAVGDLKPFAYVSPGVRFAIAPGGVAIDLRVFVPTRFDFPYQQGGVLLGLPFRYLLGPKLAFVGFEQLLALTIVKFPGAQPAEPWFTLSLPAALLFQVVPRVALSVGGFAAVYIPLPAASYLGLGASLSATVAVSRNVDLVSSGEATWSRGFSTFIVRVGTTFRF